jgi:hypothetical protein
VRGLTHVAADQFNETPRRNRLAVTDQERLTSGLFALHAAAQQVHEVLHGDETPMIIYSADGNR